MPATPTFDNFLGTDNAAASTQPFSTTLAITAHARCYVVIRPNSDTDIITNVTDSAGGAWQFKSFDDNNSIGDCQIVWVCPNHPGGATVQITVTQSTSVAMRAFVVSYNGAVNEEGYIHTDVIATNQGTLTSGNVVTGGTNRLVVGWTVPCIATTTIGAGSGETVRGSVSTGRMQCEDISKPTAGTYTVSWTFSVSGGNNSVCYAAFALYGANANQGDLAMMGVGT